MNHRIRIGIFVALAAVLQVGSVWSRPLSLISMIESR